MKKLLLIAVLFLATGAAHARERQGNMPKPIGKLPSYPPVVCVTTNWTPEPCESRQSSANTDAWEDLGASLGAFFAWLKWTETNWLGTALAADRPVPWNGVWPRPISTTVLQAEAGGGLSVHVRRWQELARSGDNVEVRGPCFSACTMVVAYVPKERLCFGEYASLHFHSARNLFTRQESLETNRWMFARYPTDIQKWLTVRGGVEKLTLDFWELPAEELWAMGYRQCKSEPPIPMTVLDPRGQWTRAQWENEARAKTEEWKKERAKTEGEKDLWDLKVGETKEK
jgi:hypothetical protein